MDEKEKTARDGTQGPMKKRADPQLVKGQSQRKTASRRMAKATHTCNDVYQVGKQGQVPHSRSAPRSQQHHLRRTRQQQIDNELGKRDYVTGTALEQGCDMRQGSRGATTGANGADAGQG